jgi:lipopolysaccharide/colanic/teichoic acid biosynthesis glycosyltransferase
LKRTFYARCVKRLVDLAVAVPVLVAAAPVIGALAVGVRNQMGAPVFFRQQRPGLGGRPFSILKFRTMTNERDARGELLPDAERLTSLGRFIRDHSLDELPQLWCVVRGDMSLVGPRPLLMKYLERYSIEQARRHEVKPGITGLAQVNGRNALSWEEKFAYDVWYVDHLDFALDLKILARTAVAAFRSKDVAAAGHATMPDFQGTRREPDAT